MTSYEIVALMLVGLAVLTGLHLRILSRRIDTVHKRISLELSLNGLRSGWDEIEASDLTGKALARAAVDAGTQQRCGVKE